MYNFTLLGQRGTLFWHAHISWLRATLYGPLIILPKLGVSYPFAKPYKEVPILFGTISKLPTLFPFFMLRTNPFPFFYQLSSITGEWWNNDTEAVISQALQNGGGPNVSDSYTLNGLPGPLYNCSQKGDR